MKTFDMLIMLLSFGCGVILLLGKGEWLLQTRGVDMEKLYDMAKMQRAYGIGLLIIGVMTAISRLFFKTALGYGIYVIAVIVVFVIMVLYVKKNCTK